MTALKPSFLLHSKWFPEALLASEVLSLTDVISMRLWQVKDAQTSYPN